MTLQEKHKEAIEIIYNDSQTPFRADLASYVSLKITKEYMKGFAEWLSKNLHKWECVACPQPYNYNTVLDTSELIELYLKENESK